MKFENWIETFIEEKNINLDDIFEVEGESGTNIMSYGVIVEHILIAPVQEQEKIKNVLVQIDFKNGDPLHFFRHLGQAIAR